MSFVISCLEECKRLSGFQSPASSALVYHPFEFCKDQALPAQKRPTSTSARIKGGFVEAASSRTLGRSGHVSVKYKCNLTLGIGLILFPGSSTIRARVQRGLRLELAKKSWR